MNWWLCRLGCRGGDDGQFRPEMVYRESQQVGVLRLERIQCHHEVRAEFGYRVYRYGSDGSKIARASTHRCCVPSRNDCYVELAGREEAGNTDRIGGARHPRAALRQLSCKPLDDRASENQRCFIGAAGDYEEVSLAIDGPLAIGRVSGQEHTRRPGRRRLQQRTPIWTRRGGREARPLTPRTSHQSPTKTSSGKNAETMKFGTSTTWLMRRSTATLATT